MWAVSPPAGCHCLQPPSTLIITQLKSWYSFYRSTKGGRLSQRRHTQDVRNFAKSIFTQQRPRRPDRESQIASRTLYYCATMPCTMMIMLLLLMMIMMMMMMTMMIAIINTTNRRLPFLGELSTTRRWRFERQDRTSTVMRATMDNHIHTV